jgi:hypothetical protein
VVRDHWSDSTLNTCVAVSVSAAEVPVQIFGIIPVLSTNLTGVAVPSLSGEEKAGTYSGLITVADAAPAPQSASIPMSIGRSFMVSAGWEIRQQVVMPRGSSPDFSMEREGLKRCEDNGGTRPEPQFSAIETGVPASKNSLTSVDPRHPADGGLSCAFPSPAGDADEVARRVRRSGSGWCVS